MTLAQELDASIVEAQRKNAAKLSSRIRLPVITNSEIRTFRRCRRLHYYSYILGFKPLHKAHELRFGNLMHDGLETWWNTAGNLDAALQCLHGATSDPLDKIKSVELMRGYHYRWVDEPITVVAVEQEFCVDIVHPDTGAVSRAAKLAGKFDAVAELNKRTLLPEHKTSSEDISEGSVYWTSLRLDSQVSTYLIGAKALGHNPEGVLYDVIAKPRLEPLSATPFEKRKYRKDGVLYANQREKDETLEEYADRLRADIVKNVDSYYRRAEISRFDHELREAQLDIWDAAEGIHGAKAAHYHPRSPDACRMYGRLCSFFDVCSGVGHLEDKSRFERVENVHQELKEATNATSNNGT